MRNFSATLVLGTFVGGCLFGQSVLSVNSGLVHYAEGKVYAAGKLVEPKFGHFPELKKNDELRTEEGRAEVLLSPGSFLRVAENSTVCMVSNRLTDTKIELLHGEALIETVDETKDKAAAMVKGNAITMLYNGASVAMVKAGVYVFNADSGRVRVYEGEAIVTSGGTQLTLKKGKETELGGALMATKFDTKLGDELLRWSFRRSGYVAMANVSAAKSFRDNGPGYGGFSLLGGGWGGGWAFNPWYGMYTFVPGNGFAYSPFGYSYWSPFTVNRFYAYAPYYGLGGYTNYSGYRNVGASSSVTAPGPAAHSETAFSHSMIGAMRSSSPSAVSSGDTGMMSGGGGRMSGGSVGAASSGASAGGGHAGGGRR
ncbi:MAG: FecR domain-containing protein [Bryobacteraceae bacterium]